MRLAPLAPLGLLPLLLACPQRDEPAPKSGPSDLEAKAIEKGCPTWSTLEGDYLLIHGSAPDHKQRFQIFKDGDGFGMYYVDGGFTRRTMKGERRENDIRFTEIPDERKKQSFEAGQEPLRRVYVEPRLEKCALRVSRLNVQKADGKEAEVGSPVPVEFVRFPKQQPISSQPCTEPLFLYEGASAWAKAKAQLDAGGPRIDHPLGEAIPVAAFSTAGADGPDNCTYDMDLWFDDLPLPEGGKALPAGAVKDGMRAWSVPAWKAPYSGNHHFEIHRYRTCDGGARERIGIACLEAVLQ